MNEFDKWNELKKKMNKFDKPIYFNEREVWFCSLGLNVGDEENGKGDLFERPIIIIKKISRNTFVCIPTSTKIKNNRYYYIFEYKNKKYSAIIIHLRLIDSKRLNRKIGRININDYNNIIDKLVSLIKNGLV